MIIIEANEIPKSVFLFYARNNKGPIQDAIKNKGITNTLLDDVDEFFKSTISEWNSLDSINLNSNNILNNNLNKKINSILKSLDLKNDEKDNLSFELEIELLKNNSDEMNKKLQFIKRKISELEDESNQFQNNLEFFSDSSSDNPLFKNVSTKINTINNKIEFWRKRLNKIEKNS